MPLCRIAMATASLAGAWLLLHGAASPNQPGMWNANADSLRISGEEMGVGGGEGE